MKTFIFCVAACVVYSGAGAQSISYDSRTIPESIKKDADVVKRYENIVFEVTDIDRASLSTHQVFTVLNGEGKDALNFIEGTSKFRSLGDVDIKVYDANGKQILKYKKKDLASNGLGDGLIDDGKTYYLNVPSSGYPVTVEFEYVVNYKGTLHYPGYFIIEPNQGVENSTFIAKVPKELDLRYKERNIALKPEVSEDGKYKLYRWSVKNMAPIEHEEGAVSFRNRYPSIALAPNKFKMDDYEGDMTSWKTFGMWYASMKKGIDVLPDNKKVFFQQLVKDVKDDREKIRLIYDYLQKNFRYVSIQLGIGGFKPFPADFTDSKKYGDCKGLSNYMQAALNAVGIKSYQALINRQSNDVPVDPAFPCNEFNHVILFVPYNKDSIWLECTSKTLDFGMLDISTENRNALVVTEDGGVLVSTPRSKPDENVFSLQTVIDLVESGEGRITTVFSTAGEYRELMNYIIEEKSDDQKQALVHYLGFKQPDEFALKKKPENQNVATLEMIVEKVPEFVAGSKMFINPRMYKIWQTKLPKAENRKLDFYFPHPFDKTDTTIIKLPEGFVSDALPQGKQLSTKYSTYATKYWVDEQKKAIYSTAHLVLKQHNIPSADYAEIKKFFDDVLMDDTQRIVIKKQ